MMIDGGSAEDFERRRRSMGIDGAHGYRPFTRQMGLATVTQYAKVRKEDADCLAALVSDGLFGVISSDPQEVADLKKYLTERYSHN